MIRILNEKDKDNTRHLFTMPNWMGANLKEKNFFGDDKIIDLYHDYFSYSYLTGLTNYKAIGKINDQGDITAMLAFYQSNDEPAWFGTQIRSKAGKQVVRDLLDYAMQINESDGRYKFYTLWSKDQIKFLRRFAYNETNKERYDYFDELYIPARHKCFYVNYWHVLFNRILLPVDTVIRCSFVKQKYRNSIPIGGNI